MELTEKQQEILGSDNNLLVIGGPGSGKTTISILKAAQIAESLESSEQKVLFLSFARATISRVIEAIEQEHNLPPKLKRQISVETYHSFFWRILNTHGYLAGLQRPLSILTPSGEAVALSTIRSAFPGRNRTVSYTHLNQTPFASSLETVAEPIISLPPFWSFTRRIAR